MMNCNIICFLGIDGSGKSTLSKYLCEELRKRNYNVSYIWWLEGENSLLRKILRSLGKSKYHYSNENLKEKKPKNNINPSLAKLFKFMYPKLVLLDYLRFGIIKVFIPKMIGQNKIMIFDRFFYDMIFGISNEFNYSVSYRSKLLKLFGSLLPEPDLIFIIKVPAEVSFSRKKEEIESLETAELMYYDYEERYSHLTSSGNKNIVTIDNTQEISTVKDQILRKTLNFVGEY